jgi:REP-associated tyrosine transposase
LFQSPGGAKERSNTVPQSFASLHCHVIFSTKHRQPWLDAEWRPRLFEYMGGIMRNHKCSMIAAGGMPGHVHLLVSLSREISVAEVTRLVKANSSGWVHENLPALGEFAWQAGYGAFAVSFSQLDVVKQYIARQEEHHQTKTFQEEFIEFLERHGIEYDLRYLWD